MKPAQPALHPELLTLMQTGKWRPALEQIDQMLSAGPHSSLLLLRRAQCLMALRMRSAAFVAAQAAQRCAPHDAAVQDAAGTLYSHGNDHARALLACNQAVALAPSNPMFLYNRASIRRYLGDLQGAERDYDRSISLNPDDYEAYKNRTDLRTQTAQENHVRELETLAAHNVADWRGEVQIRYALAKEYEDLGQYVQSFEQLTRAAKQQREHMKYDAATDTATFQWIIEAFPAAASTSGSDACDEAPVFVLGLPRTGSTLVERILDCHSQLVSAGELDCFAQSLIAAVRRQTGRAQLPRQELVAQAAKVDFAALGRDYIRRAHEVCDGSTRFIDKMPLNYLYCGLIQRALPRAKLVHVMRQPMAVCYAMYKTLFKDGYPFSYDLAEIADYYIGYRRLMLHWQSTMPGSIHQVSYESLIADRQNETRKLLQFCGLEWEDACEQFHLNPTSSSTASAAQVRRPIYDSSVLQWREYAPQLQPLRQRLEAAGIAV